MVQTFNPYSNTAKEAEIMARYRPIAPKPEVCADNSAADGEGQSIHRSPYLRSVWPHLQAKPTRTRKRGRSAVASPPPPPPPIKRHRPSCFPGMSLSSPCSLTTSPAKNLSLQGFAPGPSGLPQIPPNIPSLVALNCWVSNKAKPNLVTLLLLPCSSSAPTLSTQTAATAAFELDAPAVRLGGVENGIDLNEVAAAEKDLLQQLQGPVSPAAIIAPQPIRPIGSSISVVGSILGDPAGAGGRGGGQNSSAAAMQLVPKKPEEVEEEVEMEMLPTVVSDSHHKVRLANSAYREMVGQPECPWLDCTFTCGGRHGGVACKRICGEVMLLFSDDHLPISCKGFSCWVRIEWGSHGKKSSIDSFCEVIRLACEPKDYLFAWRFHAGEASESAASNVRNL